MTLPTLRAYQLTAVRSIARELMYRKSTLRVACTGSGKTAEMGALTRLAMRRGQRVLITAPRGELLDQAEKWVRLWNPALSHLQIGREQASSVGHEGHRVVLASLQSLREERAKLLPTPDWILSDEAHLHLEQRLDLATLWPHAKRVGFTATPDRSDLRALVPTLYESCPRNQVYEIREAIDDGFLTPPVFERIEVPSLDLSNVAVAGDDLETSSLSTALRQPAALGAVAAIALRESRDHTLVFAVDVDHAQALVDRFNRWDPGCARLAVGTLSPGDRRESLAAFEAGHIRFLVTVMLLTYGIDIPVCNCVLMARPTISRALYCQSIGRGLRLYEDKPDCLVVDLVGNTDQHTLMTPQEALKPQYGCEADLLPISNLFQTAREIGEREEGADAAVDLLDPAPDESLPDTPPAVEYEVTEVTNQLAPLGIEIGPREADELDVTWKQINYLKSLGVEDTERLSRQQATDLIDTLLARQKAGLCSVRQGHYLLRKGLKPDQPAERASRWIQAIKANHGRVPLSVRSDPRALHTGEEVGVVN